MSKALMIALLGVVLLAGLAFGERVEVSATYDDVDVTVEQSNSSRTVLRFDVGAFEQTPLEINGEMYQQVSIDREGILLYKGEPQLPRLSRSIIIPDDAQMHVKVIDAEYVDYENVPVAPSKGGFTRDIDPESIPYTFGSVYEKDEFYPAELANIRDPFIMRDYRGLVVDVNAFQYNPSTKTLRVYTSVTVEVYADGPAKINAFNSDVSAKTLTPDFDLVYERRFVNYADQSKYTSIGEAGDLLIITYDSFRDAMLPLVEWKMQKGIKTTMVDISTIGNTTSAISAFIADFYDSTNLAYVLLVGDYAQVTSPQASGGASDPTYMKLVGSDDYPDAFIGRFSAETVAHVETQVARTITYESNPNVGAWLHKGAGVASSDGAGTGHNGESDYAHMDLIRDDWLGFTYTEVDQLYATTGASAADVSAALNEGRSTINYCGHGSTTTWVTTGFSNTDVNNLTNTDMLPFIFSVACVNGEFDGPTCFAEAWLRAEHNDEPTGAIGTFMSSINQDWVPPMDGEDEMVDLIVAQEKVTMGGVCFNGSAKMIELDAGGGGVKNADTWHIFGDPTVLLRTDTPADLTVGHAAIMLFTDTHFDVTVTGEEGALCAIYHDGTLYGSAYTDGTGLASIPFADQLPIGEAVTLTVTSFNGMPYITTVQVIAPSGPYVIYDGSTIDDAMGNGNGMVDFGEAITLGVQLQNVGPDDALDVNATIATTDTYVTITDDTEAYGTVLGDFGTVNIVDAFAFDVSPNVPDGHTVAFDLSVTGTARDTWEGTFYIPVHAPTIGFVSVTIDDGATGNGNGILDPGETADIIVTVENSGSGDAFGVEAYLSETDSYVTVDDDYGLFGDIAASISANNNGDRFTVTAAGNCGLGHEVTLDMAISTTAGYTVDLNCQIVVGDRVVFYFDDFAMNQGWTGLGGTAEWTIGPAVGGGTSSGVDPADDHTPTSDNMVMGNDLTSAGNYNNNISGIQWIESPVLDCSGFTGVEMRYWHFLGCESSSYDHVYLQVHNGTTWVQLYTNGATFQETEWLEDFYDLSTYADGNANFQIRFGMGSSDGSVTYGGWNIDDIQLKGYGHVGTPNCEFADSVLTATFLPDETGQENLIVRNSGDGSLRIAFTASESWMYCNTDQHVIDPGDSLALPITFNCTGLAVGQYDGTLAFISNDATLSAGQYPVTLQVGCCIGTVGNADCSADDQVTMSDLTVLIDHLFISLSALCCEGEGNADGEGEVTMSDLTVLIDHLFISLDPLPSCK